jgi:hypothetical protein
MLTGNAVSRNSLVKYLRRWLTPRAVHRTRPAATLASRNTTSYEAQALGAYYVRQTRLPGGGYF